MSKIEFLERLEKLLADVPYTERREALNYYTEYFEDADKDEEEVIRTLGSPEEVAHNIREELAGKELAESSVSESRNVEENNDDGQNTETEKSTEKKSKLEGWQIVLIILAVVLTVPVWGGVVTGALGAVVGVIAAILGIILGLAVAAVGMFVAAIVIFVISLTKILVSPLASIFCIGLSVFLIGLAMLCLIASWKIVTVLIPAIWKGLTYIFHSVFRKKEGVAA